MLESLRNTGPVLVSVMLTRVIDERPLLVKEISAPDLLTGMSDFEQYTQEAATGAQLGENPYIVIIEFREDAKRFYAFGSDAAMLRGLNAPQLLTLAREPYPCH